MVDTAEKTYTTTKLEIRELGKKARVVVPDDATPVEAARFAVFLVELSMRHILYRWDLKERIEHYGLERFIQVEEA